MIRIGKRQLETLRLIGPSSFMIVGGKASQRHCDRLVDMGLAKYPPPSKASGKKTVGDGDWLVITSKGLAALEAAGLWPHPYGEAAEAIE